MTPLGRSFLIATIGAVALWNQAHGYDKYHPPVSFDPSLPDCSRFRSADPRAVLTVLDLPAQGERGIPESDSLDGYLETRVMDGTITEKQRDQFWKIVQATTGHAINPSGHGVATRLDATVAALACLGVDKPAPVGNLPKPGRISSKPALLAKRFAEINHVALYSDHRNFIGNKDGFLAPIFITHDKDILLVGTVVDSPHGKNSKPGHTRAVVLRLSPSGKKLWERTFPLAGYTDFEGASLIETNDGGCVVFILSYANPTLGAATRLIRLHRTGEIVWDMHFRGKGGLDTPFAEKIQLLPSGVLALHGHVYLKQGVLSRWFAEVNQDGKVLSDKSGPDAP